ncbi:hypothetical protein Syun_028459 [Stephania yunnanensis]|uniref:Uncharacterized protein n=1 Tax=Stephania yunnanensis TaxID=152371 RepID=A0AAP0EPS2_9MAGN
MPPKRNQQRIEEVFDRDNLNRQIGQLIDQRMDVVVERLTARIDQLLGLMMKPITKSEVVEKVMLRLIPDEEVKMLIKEELQRRTEWIYSHNFEQRFALLHNFVECKDQY